MAYITLLSNILGFLLIAVSANIQDIIVDKYHIDIDFYPPDNIVYVKCYVVFKNLRTTHEISMYIDDDILLRPKVSVIKKDTDVKFDFETFKHNSTTRTLTLFYKEKMNPGLYVMNITFSRFFHFVFDQVQLDYVQEDVAWLSAGHFEPIWIQRIIPCWVSPKKDNSWIDMPTFKISVLHFAYHSVLTNMPVREERLDEKALRPNMKRTYFDTTPRMSPYQLSIIVTNFTRTIIEDDVVSMWCRNRSASSLHFALTVARNITTYLHLNRELHCRFSTGTKLLVISKIQNSPTVNCPERNDSLVHPGIIIINEHDITYNEENDSVGRKYNVIRLLGYKVTQEYYEWIVNPYWEPSTWLSRGFAMFIATHNLNKIWPRMIDLFVVQIQHECLDFDVNNKMLPFPDQNNTIPAEIIDNMKAPVVLHMLQHAIISKAFWEAIDMFKYDSVPHKRELHLKFFWKALRDVYGKIKTKPKQDQVEKHNIEFFLHFWGEKKGYPLVTVNRTYDCLQSGIEIVVGNLKWKEYSEESRPIPLSFTTRTLSNFNQTQPYKWITPPYTNPGFKFWLDYNEKSWIIFNIQQTGYYRVNYDNENWRRIFTYLNKEDYLKIHVLNRAQLIDDAFQFMLLDKLEPNIFWALTHYLERERDYIAWYPMFKAIEYMSTSFQHYNKFRSISVKLAKMLNMLLQNIKYEEQLTDNDFTKALRQEAAQWACAFKISNCTKMAAILLKQHLENHTKLSSWWKKWTYCYGLMETDNITWHKTLNKIKGNDNDKILYLITCPNHLVQIKNYTSTTYTNITPNTRVQFELRQFVYTIAESVKNDEEYYVDKYLKNLLHNLADKQPRQLKLYTAILILFNNVYSSGHLQNVWSSFGLKIPEFYMREKVQARNNQVNNTNRLFERISTNHHNYFFPDLLD